MEGNILIVDDSAAIRKAMRFILEKEGYKVTEASNGADCISKIQNDTDLIISDVNMPEMDGVEMLKKIRESGPYKTLPVIILTTVSQEEMKQKGKDMGATAWLLKPFKPENLLTVINKVLG
jgi:two-component system, chemotaxis family, chemotaxis protein CheY